MIGWPSRYLLLLLCHLCCGLLFSLSLFLDFLLSPIVYDWHLNEQTTTVCWRPFIGPCAHVTCRLTKKKNEKYKIWEVPRTCTKQGRERRPPPLARSQCFNVLVSYVTSTSGVENRQPTVHIRGNDQLEAWMAAAHRITPNSAKKSTAGRDRPSAIHQIIATSSRPECFFARTNNKPPCYVVLTESPVPTGPSSPKPSVANYVPPNVDQQTATHGGNIVPW